MTDGGNQLVVATAEKLESSTSTNHDFEPNYSTEENSLNNETETRNKNVVLLYPNSSSSTCSPEESVFSIDHILESIFSELDQPTLLNCRLASRRLLHFSTIFLQKIINFEFSHSFELQNNQIVLLRNDNQDRTIDNLITLMNNSTDFPCSSFSFSFNYGLDQNVSPLTDSLTQRFFSAQGPFIRKLKLRGFLLLSALKRLLITQAPNLKVLILFSAHFQYSEEEMHPFESETEYEGVRRRDSLFIETTGREKPVFITLKKYIVSLGSGLPQLFQQQLLECSPNLVEIQMKLDWLECLVNPVNRLHLIRRLVIGHISEDNIKSLIAVANSLHQANCKVQQIVFSGCSAEGTETDLALRAREAVGKILRSCSTTCRKLWWNDISGDFHIPQMPLVEKFSFHYYCSYAKEEAEPIVTIFPKGVSLGDTFPNLKSLAFSTWIVEENPPVEKFFGNYGLLGRGDAVLPNVSKVVFDFVPTQNLFDRFWEIFPNAVVRPRAETESDDDEY